MLIKISNLAKCIFAMTTGAAILAACGNNGGSYVAPTSASSGMMEVGKAQNNQLYQYISSSGNGTVDEFDYPKSDSSIGSITGVSHPAGECTMNGIKSFWVTASGSDKIEEFIVPSLRPIVTLSESTGKPEGCAVNPRTSGLAATIISNGDVVFYQNESKHGTTMTTPLSKAYFDGYDNRENLFVDGFNSHNVVTLVELPKGARTFETIALSNTIKSPGGVQWDGNYVTVNDQKAHAIYQYSVSGTTARLKGTVSLNESSDCVQTWIAQPIVLCPDAGNDDVEVYKYPAGGNPIAMLTGSFDRPIGAVQAAEQ